LAADRVQRIVKIRSRVGKALILALSTVSFAACDRGTPGNQPASTADAQLQWTRSAEKQLREALAQAPAHGLKPDLFLKGELPDDDAQRYAALTAAALRYAQALAQGYSDPAAIAKDYGDPKATPETYTVPRPKVDVRPGLQRAIQEGTVGEWLNSLAPQTDEYRALSKAFLQYTRQASQAGAHPIPAGKAIKPGARDPRIPAIAASLSAGGYLPPQQQNAPAPATYNPALVAAVKQFQADSGMKPDGMIGKDTLAAMSSGPAGRARQIAVAMERLRWLERNPPGTRIDINTAAAFLDYWRDGAHVDHRNVVVGEPGWETPQLGTPMFQLIANPVWRVPDSIMEDEIGEKSPSWLAANGFEMRDGKMVQKPGPKNSLGLVKFDLRNKDMIYLHDTPVKALFALPDRHKSHGCIRVQNALQFAEMIARQDGIADEFAKAMASKDETYVKLKTDIPVRLLYHTAFWDGSRIQFRPDVYGWDDDVAYALGMVRGPKPKPHEHKRGEDVGP
jgi:murein L,D-transpeptidase YcbB/YkuD